MKYRVVTAFFVVVIFIGVAQSQVVVVQDGKIGPPPSDPEYCAAVEPLRPNFVLTKDTIVQGRVTDQTRAPFSKLSHRTQALHFAN
jgi:hypothetical protein